MSIDGASDPGGDDEGAPAAAGVGGDKIAEQPGGQQAGTNDARGHQRAETLTRAQYAGAIRADGPPIRPDSPGVLQSPGDSGSDDRAGTEDGRAGINSGMLCCIYMRLRRTSAGIVRFVAGFRSSSAGAADLLSPSAAENQLREVPGDKQAVRPPGQARARAQFLLLAALTVASSAPELDEVLAEGRALAGSLITADPQPPPPR